MDDTQPSSRPSATLLARLGGVNDTKEHFRDGGGATVDRQTDLLYVVSQVQGGNSIDCSLFGPLFEPDIETPFNSLMGKFGAWAGIIFSLILRDH